MFQLLLNPLNLFFRFIMLKKRKKEPNNIKVLITSGKIFINASNCRKNDIKIRKKIAVKANLFNGYSTF